MAERFYTIMIVPGTKAKLLRLRVRRGALMTLGAVTLVGAFTTLSLPLIFYRTVERARELASLRQENETLRDASKEITSLKEQVAYFESKATKFALMAGVESLPSLLGGGGLRLEPSQDEPVVSDEIEDLKERSSVLNKSFDILEKAYRDQSLLLASTPSIAPAKGMISYGYSWRKDPFTGQRAFHTGLDIVAPFGTPILAPADGIVVKAGRMAGYGNVVYLSHGNGLSTRFAHLSGFSVGPGKEISRGDVIGFIGNTGRSLGAHLHYEVLLHNRKVDPSQYILDDSASF